VIRGQNRGTSGSKDRKPSQPPQQQPPQERAIARAQEKQQQKQEALAVSGPQHMQPFLKLLDASKSMIAQVAMATIVKPERLIFIARAALSRSPELLECTPISWIGALMDCAQLGLEPIGALGHFYFVAYKNWHNRDAKGEPIIEVNGQLGYLGITELARRSGEIVYIKSEAVFDGDILEVEEGSGVRSDGKPLGSWFRHAPNYTARTKRVIAAWAKCHFKDGNEVFRVIDRTELEKARQASQAGRKDKGPWHDWEPQMCAKTAVRRLRPALPQSALVAKALGVDESVDQGLGTGRWRDLGDKAEIIDAMLVDLSKRPGAASSQVPASFPPPSSEPPSAALPPAEDVVEQTRRVVAEATEPEPEPEPEGSAEAGEKLIPSAGDLVAGFGQFGLTQEDLEAGVVTDGASPYPAEAWSPALCEWLSETLQHAITLDKEYAQAYLKQRLHLPSGIFG